MPKKRLQNSLNGTTIPKNWYSVVQESNSKKNKNTNQKSKKKEIQKKIKFKSKFNSTSSSIASSSSKLKHLHSPKVELENLALDI